MSEHLLFHLFLFHASVTWYFFPIKYLKFLVNGTSTLFLGFFAHISYLFFPFIYENPKIISQLIPQNSKVVWSLFGSILVEVFKGICSLQAILFPRPKRETMTGMPPNYLIVDLKWEDENTNTCRIEKRKSDSRKQDGKELDKKIKQELRGQENIIHASHAKLAQISYQFRVNIDGGIPWKYYWVCDINFSNQIKAQQLAVQLNYKEKHRLRSDLVVFYLFIVLQQCSCEESLCQSEQETQIAKSSEERRGRLILTPSVGRILNLFGKIRELAHICGYFSFDHMFLPSRSKLLHKKKTLNMETYNSFMHPNKMIEMVE